MIHLISNVVRWFIWFPLAVRPESFVWLLHSPHGENDQKTKKIKNEVPQSALTIIQVINKESQILLDSEHGLSTWELLVKLLEKLLVHCPVNTQTNLGCLPRAWRTSKVNGGLERKKDKFSAVLVNHHRFAMVRRTNRLASWECYDNAVTVSLLVYSLPVHSADSHLSILF